MKLLILLLCLISIKAEVVEFDLPLKDANQTLVYVFSYKDAKSYEILESMEEYFNKYPLNTLKILPFHLRQNGKYGKEASEILALSLVLYKDKFHEIRKALFESKDDPLRDALKILNISKDKFEELLQNPNVIEHLDMWEHSYFVARRAGIPSFVVNAKYIITPQDSIEKTKDLIYIYSKKSIQ